MLPNLEPPPIQKTGGLQADSSTALSKRGRAASRLPGEAGDMMINSADSLSELITRSLRRRPL